MLLAVCMGQYMQAKVRTITTRRDFELTLSKSNLVVALFYESQKSNPQLRDQNKGLIRMYEDLSSYKPYEEADVVFLKINTKRKDLADCAELYGVKDVPTCIFFKNGKRLMNQQGSLLEIQGFINRMDLQNFIDRYYGDQIKQYVAQKEIRRQRVIESENESWKPYFYPRDMVVRGYAPEETLNNME